MTFLLLLVLCQGCDKEDIQLDPEEAILGKWELSERGNWPDMMLTEAMGYTEFLSDSTVRFFDYEKQKFTVQSKYWIDDSFLYDLYTREDGEAIVLKKRFIFYDKKLRLDSEDVSAIFKTGIYIKIK